MLGYSLPTDDIIYRALLAAKRGKKKYCSVVVGIGGPDRWTYGEEMKQQAEIQKKTRTLTIQAAMDIFEPENVRAYTHGIPQVFSHAGDVKESIKRILYPTEADLDCFNHNGVVR